MSEEEKKTEDKPSEESSSGYKGKRPGYKGKGSNNCLLYTSPSPRDS